MQMNIVRVEGDGVLTELQNQHIEKTEDPKPAFVTYVTLVDFATPQLPVWNPCRNVP